jgi:hypothetical protein
VSPVFLADMQSVEARFFRLERYCQHTERIRSEDRFLTAADFASMLLLPLRQFRIQGILLYGNTNNHQFQVSRPVIYEGMRFVKTDRYGVALMGSARFRR